MINAFATEPRSLATRIDLATAPLETFFRPVALDRVLAPPQTKIGPQPQTSRRVKRCFVRFLTAALGDLGCCIIDDLRPAIEAVMRTSIDLAALPALKSDLRVALPNVGSSHRMEALARGLHNNTYAAMRAKLADGPNVIEPNDDAFDAYLADHNYAPSPRALRRTLAKLQIRRVMDAEADLTTAGFGVGWDWRETPAERRAKKATWRADLLHDVSADEFELARLYVDQLARRKTLNRDFSSYNLKHQAERLSRSRGIATHLGNYVPNGVFIAAALSAGFTVKRCRPGSLNGFINATTPSIRAAQTGRLIDRATTASILGEAMEAEFD